MQKYWRLNIKINSDNAYVEKSNLTEEYEEILKNGNTLPENFQLTLSIKNKTKSFPDLMGDSILSPIVSDKMKNILESSIDCNFLEFRKCNLNINLKSSFWLLNILQNLTAMDMGKSKFTTLESNPRVINKIMYLELNKEAISTRNIFRLKEKPFHIFVSESLKSTLEANNITGLWFIKNMDLTTNKEVE